MKHLFLLFVCSVASYGILHAQGACCISGKCSAEANQAACENKGGLYAGDGTVCPQKGCPPVNGLCCISKDGGFGFICGPGVTRKKCETASGDGAFWKGTVKKCPTGDPKTVCEAKLQQLEISAGFAAPDRRMELAWQLPTAINQDGGFYIQRSKDGKQFKTIGFVAANANAAQNHNYRFNDPYPLLENYYRLSWYGDRTYQSQNLYATAAAKAQLLLFLNASQSQLRVVLANMQMNATDVSIYDISGRLVLKQHTNRGEQNIINTMGLPKGIFAVRVMQNGQVQTGRFVKN